MIEKKSELKRKSAVWNQKIKSKKAKSAALVKKKEQLTPM